MNNKTYTCKPLAKPKKKGHATINQAFGGGN